MTSCKIRLADKIGRFYRFCAYTQMRYGKTAWFFRIVWKITLNMKISIISDNFYCILISAHCSVRAESPHLAWHGIFRYCVRFFLRFKGKMSNVIGYSNCEYRLLGISENCCDLSRSGILRSQTVSSWINRYIAECWASESRTDVQKQRFTYSARLFCSVQNCNALDSFGNFPYKAFSWKRSVKPYTYKSVFSAFFVKILNCFIYCICNWAHCHNYVFRIGRAAVIEQLVISIKQFIYFSHIVFYNFRQSVIIDITRFPVLEEYIGILSSTSHIRICRVQRSVTEAL